MKGIIKILHELRRWAMGRKNVRSTLNLVRTSLFVLIQSKDYSLQRQITTWFESTLWQKRMLKFGVSIPNNQLGKEKAMELVPEWVKALVTPSTIRRYCEEIQVNNTNAVLFAYAIELCRQSSLADSGANKKTFAELIEMAKASLQVCILDEVA